MMEKTLILQFTVNDGKFLEGFILGEDKTFSYNGEVEDSRVEIADGAYHEFVATDKKGEYKKVTIKNIDGVGTIEWSELE